MLHRLLLHLMKFVLHRDRTRAKGPILHTASQSRADPFGLNGPGPLHPGAVNEVGRQFG